MPAVAAAPGARRRAPFAAARRRAALLLAGAAFSFACGAATPAGAPVPASVLLDELTSTELAARVAAGTTTVLLPIGGTEQNGAHMALGKHNRRALLLAQRIAQQLGDAVVAPVLAYVPEGEVEPPTGHMRWPGTISVPPAAFEATLAGAARSLQRHGLCQVVLLGDHGGYRASIERVAARLNAGRPVTTALTAAAATAAAAAAKTSTTVKAVTAPAPTSTSASPTPARCRVHPLPEYYRASSDDLARALRGQGHATAAIGSHAGLADTALMLAVDPAYVRAGALAPASGAATAAAAAVASGVSGDPSRASAELGRPAADHIVAATVAAIRAATRAP